MSGRFMSVIADDVLDLVTKLNNLPEGYTPYTPVLKHGGYLHQIFERTGDNQPPPVPEVVLDRYLYGVDDYLAVIEEGLAYYERMTLRVLMDMTVHIVRLESAPTYLYTAYRMESTGAEIIGWDALTSGDLARLIRAGMEKLVVAKIPAKDAAAYLRNATVSHSMSFLEAAYGVRFQRDTRGVPAKITAQSTHTAAELK